MAGVAGLVRARHAVNVPPAATRRPGGDAAGNPSTSTEAHALEVGRGQRRAAAGAADQHQRAFLVRQRGVAHVGHRRMRVDRNSSTPRGC